MKITTLSAITLLTILSACNQAKTTAEDTGLNITGTWKLFLATARVDFSPGSS